MLLQNQRMMMGVSYLRRLEVAVASQQSREDGQSTTTVHSLATVKVNLQQLLVG